MTTFDRFDPFERRISDAIDEIAATRLPEYLDDILRQTVRTAQRPRWTFLERWLPVDAALARPGLARQFPVRQLLILALVGLLAVAAAAYFVGSQHRVPLPFGPAGNGAMAYTSNGDIFIRDSISATPRLLVGGDGTQQYPSFSPDGTLLAFVTTQGDTDHFMVGNADGTEAREVAQIPATGNAWVSWAPDSARIAFVYDVNGIATLSVDSTDGTPATTMDLGGLLPLDVTWSPPSGASLLFRARIVPGDSVDLFLVEPDGTGLRPFGLPGTSPFGPEYTLSGAAFSPDGRAIAYNSIESQAGRVADTVNHFRIRLIGPDGTSAKAVPGPSDPYVQEGWPAYSPDGKWILVHRWVFTKDSLLAKPEGWLAVMPADGSAPARDIGPRVPGGEDTALSKLWSPDGSRVLVRADNTHQVFSIDPVTGAYDELAWTTELPDWQRIAPP